MIPKPFCPCFHLYRTCHLMDPPHPLPSICPNYLKIFPSLELSKGKDELVRSDQGPCPGKANPQLEGEGSTPIMAPAGAHMSFRMFWASSAASFSSSPPDSQSALLAAHTSQLSWPNWKGFLSPPSRKVRLAM